jgi:DNA-directed RNA polymerase subunit RPC12/RpoP
MSRSPSRRTSSTFTRPSGRLLTAAEVSRAVSVHLRCSACGHDFPLEGHAGLVQCAPCAERRAYRIEARPGRTVVMG